MRINQPGPKGLASPDTNSSEPSSVPETAYWITVSSPSVIALDMAPEKLELAQSCGGDITITLAEEDPIARVKELNGDYGADVYIEATGHPSAVQQGLNILRKLGRFVEYSVFTEKTTVDSSIVSDDKELDVLGAHLGSHCLPAAIKLITDGNLPMNEFCTHQFAVENVQQVLDFVADSSGSSVKVSTLPEGEAPRTQTRIRLTSRRADSRNHMRSRPRRSIWHPLKPPGFTSQLTPYCGVRTSSPPR